MSARFGRFVVNSGFVATLALCAVPSAFAEEHGRLFGILPNYTTVDERPSNGGPSGETPALTRTQSFKVASLSSFDPVVFPYVGFMTSLGGKDNYRERYMRSFADNAIGNFMTTAVVPAVTNEDPRYFRSGQGGAFRRLAYAASRSVVGRTRSGGSTFNVSEVGGSLAAAGLSNLYYAPADRTVNGTLSRWGTQVMWDTVANELKEFWPDIRARLRRP